MSSPFTIYVMQSAHTDIGYTHPQEQIMDMYLDHYERVLEFCSRTKNDPAAHKFKWTCETFWQVENFWNKRPDRRAEFLEYVRSGQIEITASYLHFADLIDADTYRRSVQRAVDFCREHDLPLKTAMHCDINGWAWAAADIFAEFGIPNFCSQVHLDNATDPLGARGSVHYHWVLEFGDNLKQDVPIRVPQAFWWVGPKGGRSLHWLNEHYMLGNVLGISGSRGFAADKTRYFYETDLMTADDLYARASREVPLYVDRLKQAGYSYEGMLISTGGFYTDNSRPDERWCGVIERWNAEHTDIRMQTVTVSEWFDVLNSYGTEALPSRNMAWPDCWAHGLGTMTARIAQARRVQRRRAGIVQLVQQSGSAEAERDLETALQQELYAMEHTFDAWSTVWRPELTMNGFQQAAKELTFYRTDLYLEDAAQKALRVNPEPDPKGAALHVPGVEAAYTATLHFTAEDRAIDPAAHQLADEQGNTFPIQVDHGNLSQHVATVPLTEQRARFYLTEAPDSVTGRGESNGTRLRSSAWQLEIDPSTGALRSMRDNAREWVDPNHQYGFGQFVHEAVTHPAGREAVANQARFLALDIAGDPLKQTFDPSYPFRHTLLTIDEVAVPVQGGVFDAITVRGHADPVGTINLSWRVYHAAPIVELVVDWYKTWSDLPEAAYIAFPFAVPSGKLELETAGSFFVPGSHDDGGQLPGTDSTFYTIQHAARITDGDTGLYWLPVDAPLVMTNELNYNRWETQPYQWNGFLASMPVNHYWHTNFPTSQRGYIRLRYRFGSTSGTADHRMLLPVDAYGWR